MPTGQTKRKPRATDKRGSASSAERIALTEDERRALELRKGGATLAEIARVLGYADPSGAHKAIRRALDATLQQPAEELRRLEAERLDVMLLSVWTKVRTGDPRAITSALAIMDRRAKLLGLDAPSKRQIEVVTMDSFSAAMHELEGEIADLEARKLAEAELAVAE